MTELRKCPFCWGEAEVWVSDVTDRAVVYCKGCDAQIRIRQNEQEAIEAWNKRAYANCTNATWCEHYGEDNE